MEIQTLSESAACNIRRSGNPDRAIGPETHMYDLDGKSYDELIAIFQARIYDRYIKAAEFVDNNGDYNFIVTIICCVILDLFSQYVYGIPSSTKKVFLDFFRKYFKEYNLPIKPPIISCYFKNKWIKEEIKDVAHGFYHCFRCGVVHSGMILEYGRINKRYPEEVVRIVEWEKGKQEIIINPSKLLQVIKDRFNAYIEELKSNKVELKRNFIKKLKFDFGFEFR